MGIVRPNEDALKQMRTSGLKALFQITQDDGSRGKPQYGHVYVVLKDGTHSSRPIFQNVLRKDIEDLFDEIVEYRPGSISYSRIRMPDTAQVMDSRIRLLGETEEDLINEKPIYE